MNENNFFVVVQLCNHVQLFPTPWTAVLQASLSFTIYRSLLIFISIESVMPFNHLILYCPPSLLALVFPNIRVFSLIYNHFVLYLFIISTTLVPNQNVPPVYNFIVNFEFCILMWSFKIISNLSHFAINEGYALCISWAVLSKILEE